MKAKDKTGKQIIDELTEPDLQQVAQDLQLERQQFLAVCDNIDAIVCVSDPVTYEILFANKTLEKLYQKSLTGGTCYKELQGRAFPCEFCTRPHKWEYYSPLLNRHFMIEDKAIKWPDGRDVKLEFAIDITHRKKEEEAIRRQLEFMDTVKRISSRFVGVSDIDEAINESLADIGIISGAGRAYLFYMSQDETTMSNTHEWCAEGVLPQKDRLQNVPNNELSWWMEKLNKGEVIHIPDVAGLPAEAQAEKELLESQDIKSLLALPLYVRGKLSGFIGFDNVTGTGSWSDGDLALLRVSSEIIGSAYERKLADEALRESENKYRTIFENTGTALAIIEEDSTISLVNSEFEKYTGFDREEILGRKSWGEFFRDIPLNNFTPNFESQFADRAGNVKDVIINVARLPGTGKLVVSLLDITERKRMEKQMKYLSFRFRKSDIVARIGGDEFAVILPKSNREVAERACRNIRNALAEHNAANPQNMLNLSIGFAVKEDPDTSMAELFKEADNSMYREKLHHKESARSAVVQALTRALAARDFITEGHAGRLQRLVASMAAAIGIPEHKIADLCLLAQFHDIGKVGVSDRLLFKPGPLTPEERHEIEQHCSIGYRIALAAPDLAPIADWILKHHEWWNGGGYPLGLKGEEIPLECRILAIADAYDAMTSDRPYRKAITHEEAVKELERCAGSQFDPVLTPKFIQVLKTIKST